MRKSALLSLLFSLFLTGLFSGTAHMRAQGDPAAQWKVFDVPVPFHPFFSRFRPHAAWTPFFLDSVRGYVRWNSVNLGGNDGWYYTEDGGENWELQSAVPPFPHEMKGEFGVANNGKKTTDGGQTWRSFFADSAVSIGRLVYGDFPEQGLPQVMAAFVGASPGRLVFTTDAGSTWTYADKTISYPNPANPNLTITVLNDTLLFGIAPTDEETGRFHWGTLLGISGDTLFVTTRKVGANEVAERADEYWRVNLRTGTARHWTMDTLSQLILGGLQRSPSGLLYTWNSVQRSQTYLARSTDEGRTWGFSTDYSWVDFTYFRFLSPTYGVSSNAVTTDGGVTWKKWKTEHEITAFFPADSLHWYGLNSRQFLRTTDGGQTWRTGGDLWKLDEIDAIHAWKKRMVVGAGVGNLLASADSAENWVNLRDIPGALPDRFNRLRAVAAPDSAGEPDRLVALATFYNADSAAYYAAMMESEDGGMTWERAALLPEFDSVIAQPWTMQFVRNESGEGVTGFLKGGRPAMLYRSDDGGRSWQFVTEEVYPSLAMADDKHGIAGREGALLRTTNGGLSWTVTRSYTAPLRFVYGLTAFDRDRYAGILPNNLQVPSEWRSIHSGDGGVSWSLLRGPAYAINDPGFVYWRSPREVYSLSSLGLLYSSDSGKGFALLHNGLQLSGTTQVISDDSYIYQFNADSARVGRWRIQDFASSVHEGEGAEADERLRLTVLELPVRDVLRLRYAAAGSAPVSGSVYDIQGRPAADVPYRILSGDGILEIDVSPLASGTYVLRLTSEGRSYVRPVVVVR